MSAGLKKVHKKINNTPSATKAKIQIRRNVLDAIGAKDASVFDAFAGDGEMYDAVWNQAARCVGCDLEFYRDERLAFKADNRRVLRVLDLAQFNIFDLDAHGSPWTQVYIIASRRKLKPGEMLGLIVTEGQGIPMKMGGMSWALATLTGTRQRMPGLGRKQDELIYRAVRRTATMMGGTVQKQWIAASKSASTMHYLGAVLRGN